MIQYYILFSESVLHPVHFGSSSNIGIRHHMPWTFLPVWRWYSMAIMLNHRSTAFIYRQRHFISFVVKDGCHYQTMDISLFRFVVATRHPLPSQVCIRSRKCSLLTDTQSSTLKIGSGCFVATMNRDKLIFILSSGKSSLINYSNPDYN